MTARNMGIGIVMIIPAFIGSGALWEIFESWPAVIVWIIITACAYGAILFAGHKKRVQGSINPEE
jgi:FtsH-binding integral membrane protein